MQGVGLLIFLYNLARSAALYDSVTHNIEICLQLCCHGLCWLSSPGLGTIPFDTFIFAIVFAVISVVAVWSALSARSWNVVSSALSTSLAIASGLHFSAVHKVDFHHLVLRFERLLQRGMLDGMSVCLIFAHSLCNPNIMHCNLQSNMCLVLRMIHTPSQKLCGLVGTMKFDTFACLCAYEGALVG